MKRLMTVALMSLLFLVPIVPSISSVQAVGLSSNIMIATDYIWRGLPQRFEYADDNDTEGKSEREFTLSFGTEYDFGGGFSLGAWASEVSFRIPGVTITTNVPGEYRYQPFQEADVELNLYAQYSNTAGENFDWTLGYLHYAYPGAESGPNDLNFSEIYLDVLYKKFLGLTFSEGVGDAGDNIEFTYSTKLNVVDTIFTYGDYDGATGDDTANPKCIYEGIGTNPATDVGIAEIDGCTSEDFVRQPSNDNNRYYSVKFTAPFTAADYSLEIIRVNYDDDNSTDETKAVFSISKSF